MVDSSTLLDSSYAMPEYKNSKFDGKLLGIKLGFSNDRTDWNKQKGGTFIDWYIKKKAHVPASNMYNAVNSIDYLAPKQPNYSLYKSPRKTGFAEMIAKAEKHSGIGPGTFNPKGA